MPVTVRGDAIVFNDGSVQTTSAGAPTTTQVLNATAGAAAGAVGTYATAIRTTMTTSTTGSTIAGSSLRYADTVITLQTGAYGSVFYAPNTAGALLTGTWRCMGIASTSPQGNYGSSVVAATLWLRIS